MDFYVKFGRGVYEIRLNRMRYIMLREIDGEAILAIDVNLNTTTMYEVQYNLNSTDTPTMEFNGIAIANPFWDDDHSNEVNPIKYYGKDNFYKWVINLLMTVCVPENLVE